MTAFYVKDIYYALTLYMDLWNNEIVSHALSSRRGDRMTYISGLEDLLALKQQFPEHEMILHSDQGSVYSSKKYNELSASVTTISPDAFASSTLAQINYSLVSSSRSVPNRGSVR